MTEPHTAVVATTLTVGAGATPVLLVMGAQVDALVIGLIAAIFVSIMTDAIDNKLKAAAAVLFASMLAGFASPVAAQWVAIKYPHLVVTPTHEILRLLSALLIGAVTPRLVPLAARWMDRKGAAK